MKNRAIIIRNAAHCETCDTVIESQHRHDWVACKCEKTGDPETETYIFVDGGHDYIRFGAGNAAKYTPLYELSHTLGANGSCV